MKKTFLLTTILAGATTLSSAAYANQHNSYALDSLFFRPASDEIVGTTKYTHEINEYKSSGVNSEDISKTITQSFDFGINERLSATVSLSHTEVEYKDETSTLDADGFNNPEISLKYRTAHEKSDGFISDITLAIAPDIFTAKSATANVDGTVASGGNIFALAVDYGRNFENSSYKVTGTTIYSAKSKFRDAETGDAYTDDEETYFNLAIETQYKLSDKISLNIAANKYFVLNETSLGAKLNYKLGNGAFITLAYDSINTRDDGPFTEDETSVTSASLKYRF